MPTASYPSIVLRTYKFGEADRVVVLLSQQGGKLRGVAKGVRKAGSRFGARLEPGSCVRVDLHQGKGQLQTIVGVEIISQYPQIRHNLDRLLKVARMLEVVDSITLDGVPHQGIYDILKGALDALESRDTDMLMPAFLWRVLQNEGTAPHFGGQDFGECSICGGTQDLVRYDVADGGLTCSQHPRGAAITPEALGALAQILGGQVRQVLERSGGRPNGASPDPVASELELLAERVLQSHSERSLKSLKNV